MRLTQVCNMAYSATIGTASGLLDDSSTLTHYSPAAPGSDFSSCDHVPWLDHQTTHQPESVQTTVQRFTYVLA
jgi:hypothetical protein